MFFFEFLFNMCLNSLGEPRSTHMNDQKMRDLVLKILEQTNRYITAPITTYVQEHYFE